MRLTISTNFPEVERSLDRLRADVADTVRVRAVNRTMEQAQTAMNREIRKDYNLRAKDVRERLSLSKAVFRGGSLAVEATLTASGSRRGSRSANVMLFDAKQVKAGVSVRIKRGGSKKVIAGAFIGNKNRTVFRRTGKKRLPIEPVQTIDVPQMFTSKRVNQAVIRVIEQKFPEVFAQQLKFALNRFKRGGR